VIDLVICMRVVLLSYGCLMRFLLLVCVMLQSVLVVLLSGCCWYSDVYVCAWLVFVNDVVDVLLVWYWCVKGCV